VDHANPESLPLWFPFFFISLWLVVGALLGALSRWRTLAQRFRTTLRPTGTAIKNQVVSIGKIPEHRVTHMVASEAGLYLWVNPLFRFPSSTAHDSLDRDHGGSRGQDPLVENLRVEHRRCHDDFRNPTGS
jgi:hypothetical protein